MLSAVGCEDRVDQPVVTVAMQRRGLRCVPVLSGAGLDSRRYRRKEKQSRIFFVFIEYIIRYFEIINYFVE